MKQLQALKLSLKLLLEKTNVETDDKTELEEDNIFDIKFLQLKNILYYIYKMDPSSIVDNTYYSAVLSGLVIFF